ncbi:MAG: PAS domain S-box protein [Desulfobacterales bacterium]|nr:PAS domain S-box protein [Desulfobacterales bacterium]
MPKSENERQRKWKTSQKDKKWVTAMLSEEAHNILKKEKNLTGTTFSAIIDKAICNLSKPAGRVENGLNRAEEELKKINNYLHELVKEHTTALPGISKQLDKEVAGRTKAEESLKKSEERFRNIIDNSYDMIYRANLNKDTFDYVSPSSKKVIGYSAKEMISLGFKKTRTLVHPDDYDRLKDHFNILSVRNPNDINPAIEHRMKHKKHGYRWMSHNRTVIFDENNKTVAVIGNIRDVTKRKQAEEELRKFHGELEKKVTDRTFHLEEANTALKVLLQKMDKDKLELEDKILLNIKELIMPNLEKIIKTRLSDKQKKLLEILESNLNTLISPFSKKLTSRYFNLTHGEMQVANLLMHGRTNKEIADLMNLSSRTIEYHRAQIRKKIGISGKKESLRAHLLSLQ